MSVSPMLKIQLIDHELTREVATELVRVHAGDATPWVLEEISGKLWGTFPEWLIFGWDVNGERRVTSCVVRGKLVGVRPYLGYHPVSDKEHLGFYIV